MRHSTAPCMRRLSAWMAFSMPTSARRLAMASLRSVVVGCSRLGGAYTRFRFCGMSGMLVLGR